METSKPVEKQSIHLDQGEADLRSGGLDIREIGRALWVGKWTILIVLIIALAYARWQIWKTAPIYSGDAVIQVEKGGGGVRGIEDISPSFDEESSISTEVAVLRSRYVLGRVANTLNLDLVVSPVYFPVFGKAWARNYSGGSLASSPLPDFLPLDDKRYSWGGESIEVQRFDVPDSLRGEEFIIRVGIKEGSFTLLKNSEILTEGRVGEPAIVDLDQQRIGLFVADLEAQAGTEFTVQRKPLEDVTRELQRRVLVREVGLRSGVIQVGLNGTSRSKIRKILDSITNQYVQLNVEKRSAQADQTLEFLDAQLPVIRGNVTESEVRLSEFRTKNEALDVAREAETFLNRSIELDQVISQKELEAQQLSQVYGSAHPSLRAVYNELAKLRNQKKKLQQQVSGLPDIQQELLGLTRDVEVATSLYTEVLNRALELKLVRAGTVGNAAVLDKAVVGAEPVAPVPRQIFATSIVLGLILGSAIVLIRRLFRKGLRDPQLLEQELGLPLYAAIPYSPKEAGVSKKRRKGVYLSKLNPDDPAIEAIRSLRTSMHFAMLEADGKSNVVQFSGATKGAGKSFVSINLAHLIAQSGKSVVLVDGDMRRGHVQASFSSKTTLGLSSVLAGTASLEEVLVKSDEPNLSLVFSGQFPPNPGELLMSEALDAVITQLSNDFDVVIVDSAPILAVADPAILAPHCGAVFLVLHSEHNTLDEAEECLRRFSRTGVTISGAVVNGLKLGAGGYSYANYRYYSY